MLPRRVESRWLRPHRLLPTLYSGRFSGVAKNSNWVSNGSVDHPVHEVMVAANLFDVLNNVVAIGNHPHHIHGGGLAPYIVDDYQKFSI